jgi:3-phenylpropionate/cinnamic acid dioxygenase small subunit
VSEHIARAGAADPTQVDPADRAVAAELLARYAELIDDGDLDGLGELFGDAVIEAPDGTVIASGSDEVAALYRATTRLHEDGTPGTAHLVTNVIVDVAPGEPDRLRVRSRFCVLQAVDGFPLQPVVVGRYVDVVARAEDGWRFERRRMIPERWGDTSAHLTWDPRAGA